MVHCPLCRYQCVWLCPAAVCTYPIEAEIDTMSTSHYTLALIALCLIQGKCPSPTSYILKKRLDAMLRRWSFEPLCLCCFFEWCTSYFQRLMIRFALNCILKLIFVTFWNKKINSTFPLLLCPIMLNSCSPMTGQHTSWQDLHFIWCEGYVPGMHLSKSAWGWNILVLKQELDIHL